MDITLPRTITNANVVSLIYLLEIAKKIEKQEIDFDCSQLAYIEPAGIAFLAAALGRLSTEHKKTITFYFLSSTIANYLQRMDFFQLVEVEGVDFPTNRNRNNLSGSLCELKCLTEEHQAEKEINTFAIAITGNMGFEENESLLRSQRAIHYALSELVLNSLTHAKREGRHDAKVWIAAQYYSQKKCVKAAVVDDGCGFLRTLKDNHAEVIKSPTHVTALSEALKERVSCNRVFINVGQSTNQGIGLTITDRMIRQADGTILISSGDALYYDYPNNLVKKNERVSPNVASWQGVGIAFELPRDGLHKVHVPDLLPSTEWDTNAVQSESIEINFT